jgi:hypothetical protein
MTLSTDQTILNERYRKAHRRKLSHGGHTANPTPYDDHVELFTSFHLCLISGDRYVQLYGRRIRVAQPAGDNRSAIRTTRTG